MTTETDSNFDSTDAVDAASLPRVVDFQTFKETGVQVSPTPAQLPEPGIETGTPPQESVNLYKPEQELSPFTEDLVNQSLGSKETDAKQRWTKSRAAKILARTAIGTVLVGTPLLAGIAAVEDMPATHTSIVGLEATSSLRIGQDSSNLDTGVLGSFSSSAHRNLLGVNFGMDVSVNGDELNLNDSTTRNALGEILSKPQPEIDRVVSETATDARDEFLLEAGKIVVFEMLAGGLILGGRRFFGPHGELLDNAGQRNFYRFVAKPVGAAFFAGTVLAPAVHGFSPIIHQENAVVIADPAFTGTGLAGMQLKGPINNAVPTIVNGFQPSEKLNDATAKNALELFASRPDLQPQEGWVNYMQADDLQDRSSMAEQVGIAAKALKVRYLLLSGDASTISQLGFGSYIMDTVRHYSDGIETWFLDGDHDTSQTNYYAKLAGFNVADNKTHIVGGIPTLFLNSISESTLGVDGIPTKPRETDVDSTDWLANALKEIQDTNPQIVALHDYKAAISLAKAAIIAGHPIPFIDAGRSFKQLGPVVVKVPKHDGSTVVFVSGSSGGHNNTSPEFGNIPIDSPVNLFSRNITTGQVNVVTIIYHPDGSVTASQPTEIVAPSTVTESAGGGAVKKTEAAGSRALSNK